jgi:PHP family Zn ribbon phosphoesterase
LGNKCPACGRRLTKGVEQRVEELADRPSDYKPDGAIPFMHLLPLHEIIATTLEIDRLSSSRIWEIYNAMIGKFGNEYAVLIEASREDISKLVGPDIADLIVKVREGRVRIDPGYDGVYGKLVIEKQKPKKEMRLGPQRGLNEFI